jgi:probable phosphoglycerate mutase
VRLILVRHALPHRTDGGPGHGPADPGLTDLGHEQAERVAVALAGVPLDGLYSSPQRRARETAEPLARLLGRVPTPHDGLAEYDSRVGHYIPVHEMAEADPESYRRMRDGQLPGDIDVPVFADRVVRALSDIGAAHPGPATVACFAHAGTINVFLMRLLGLDRPLAFPLDYTGITRVHLSRSGRRSVRTVNEIGHVADLLDRVGAPSG